MKRVGESIIGDVSVGSNTTHALRQYIQYQYQYIYILLKYPVNVIIDTVYLIYI